MSAGTGIYHSEFNASQSDEINLFQLWIFPNQQEVSPRYQQMAYDQTKMKDAFLQLVSPNPDDEGLWIHQDAWINIIDMLPNSQKVYSIKKPGNGVYLMNIEGQKVVEKQTLMSRDAIGIWETSNVEIKATESGRILIIEVPMKF
jgi:redox-sensitive bicupin YhaK (pirin superfamily)